MNRFFCWLTGGHKYDNCNVKIEQCPDDVRKMFVTNHCVKCGMIRFSVLDENTVIQNALEKE